MTSIDFDTISVGYDYPLIQGLSFSVKTQGFLGIVGKNGSGKSTILKAIIGKSTIFGGTIHIQGSPRNPHKTKNLLTQGILYLHTGSSLFLGLTVQDHRDMIGKTVQNKETLGKRMNRIEENLSILCQWNNQKVGSLSGGQRQIVMLSIAIILMPPILLLDEPTVGISEKRQPLITKIIDHLQENGVSGIIVDHNQALIQQWCDTIITLD